MVENGIASAAVSPTIFRTGTSRATGNDAIIAINQRRQRTRQLAVFTATPRCVAVRFGMEVNGRRSAFARLLRDRHLSNWFCKRRREESLIKNRLKRGRG